MPSHISSSSSSSTDGFKNFGVEDEEWRDTEPDEERAVFQCLFEMETFDNVQSFLEHCKHIHNFDLAQIRSELGP